MVMATKTPTAADISLTSVTLEVTDLAAADAFYRAFGVDAYVRLQASEAPSTGFRGFTVALTVSQPGTVDGFVSAAVDAGATVLKSPSKSFWGYAGVVQAPDGTIWKIATSAKKDTGPATRTVDEVVLLLGVEDVKATKQCYVGQGLTVAKSFGGKYVEFTPGRHSRVKLALYKRTALAKDLGVAADGTGSHRVVLGGADDGFTDLDGFVWEAAPPAAKP